MTRPAADRVKVEWLGSGTGTMTLGSNVSGFQGFPSALNGHVVSYLIEHTTATEFEAGFGVYTSSGNTLTRAYRTYPTPGGPAVNFSAGIKHVRLTVISFDIAPNIATTDPTSTDGFSAGYVAGQSRWLNTTDNGLWFCVDHTNAAAVWTKVTPPSVETIWPTAPNTFLVNDASGVPVNVVLAGGLTLVDGTLSASGTSSLAAWPYEAISGTTHSPVSLKWYEYTNVGAVTVTLDGAVTGSDAEGVLQKGSGSGVITIARATGFTINGGTAAVVLHGKAIYKRKGATTDFVVTGDIGEPTLAFSDHDHADKVLYNAEFRDLSETTQITTGVTGSISYDYRNGAFLDLTLSGAVTAFAITNVPVTTKGATMLIVLRNTNSRSFAWPTGTKWPGGIPPTLSSAASGVDVFSLVTRNGGTEWLGFNGGQGFS